MAIWVRRNGGNWNNNPAANPATNTDGVSLAAYATSVMYPLAMINNATLTFNFGATMFAYPGTIPSGFTAGWPRVGGGFTTLDPSSVIGDGSVGGGNLTLGGGSAQTTATGLDGYLSGKFYYEFTVNSFDIFTSTTGGGVSKSPYSAAGAALGTVGTFLGSHNDCDLIVGGSVVQSDLFTASVGDVISVAVILEGATPTPTANPDTATTPENTAVQINVLANDNANGGVLDPTSVVISGAPSHGGTAVNATTGVVTYTPTTSYTGTDVFHYTVANTNGNRSTATTVTVTITALGTPIAYPISATTPENVAVNISVNATPGTGGTLDYTSVVISTAATNGATAVNATTGVVTYTPNTNFVGSDVYYYTIADTNTNRSNAAAVVITVTAVIVAPPTVAPVSASTPENTAVQVNLLAGAQGGGGTLDPTSVVITTLPSHGAVTVSSAGVATYTPATGFSGVDTFQFNVADTNGSRSVPATATITVVPPLPPIANNDNAVTQENAAVAITVLANDVGAGGTLDPTSVVISTAPTFGATSVNHTTGVVTYTPPAGFSGNDTFQYTVADTNGVRSNAATVFVTITALVPPTAVLDAVTTPQNVAVAIPVLANDQGGSGSLDPTTVVLATNPTYGNATVSATTGVVTYTPNVNFFGVDIFSYTVADTNGIRSNPGPIIVTVVTSIPDGNNNHVLRVGPDIRGMIYNWRLSTPGVPSSSTLYTIINGPSQGQILRDTPEPSANWVPTTAFTQADIDGGYIAYQNTAGTLGVDTFTVSIQAGILSPVQKVFTVDIIGPNEQLLVQSSGVSDIFCVPPDFPPEDVPSDFPVFPVPSGQTKC